MYGPDRCGVKDKKSDAAQLEATWQGLVASGGQRTVAGFPGTAKMHKACVDNAYTTCAGALLSNDRCCQQRSRVYRDQHQRYCCEVLERIRLQLTETISQAYVFGPFANLLMHKRSAVHCAPQTPLKARTGRGSTSCLLAHCSVHCELTHLVQPLPWTDAHPVVAPVFTALAKDGNQFVGERLHVCMDTQSLEGQGKPGPRGTKRNRTCR